MTHGPRSSVFQPKTANKKRRKHIPKQTQTGLWRKINQEFSALLEAPIPAKFFHGINRKRLQTFCVKLKKMRPSDIIETLADALDRGKEAFTSTLTELMSRKIETQS